MKLDLLATGLTPQTAAAILELADNGKVERFFTSQDAVVIPFERTPPTTTKDTPDDERDGGR